MSQILIPLYENYPNNRQYRNKFRKESAKCKILFAIDRAFREALNADIDVSFEEMYGYYNSRYKKACSALNETNKFTFFRINENYIKEVYGTDMVKPYNNDIQIVNKIRKFI